MDLWFETPLHTEKERKWKGNKKEKEPTFFSVILFKSSTWMKNLLKDISRGWGEMGPATLPRGRIFGRNPDKIVKSFPPYHSQSPLQKPNS
jgi:hypothetical protein